MLVKVVGTCGAANNDKPQGSLTKVMLSNFQCGSCRSCPQSVFSTSHLVPPARKGRYEIGSLHRPSMAMKSSGVFIAMRYPPDSRDSVPPQSRHMLILTSFATPRTLGFGYLHKPLQMYDLCATTLVKPTRCAVDAPKSRKPVCIAHWFKGEMHTSQHAHCTL